MPCTALVCLSKCGSGMAAQPNTVQWRSISKHLFSKHLHTSRATAALAAASVKRCSTSPNIADATQVGIASDAPTQDVAVATHNCDSMELAIHLALPATYVSSTVACSATSPADPSLASSTSLARPVPSWSGACAWRFRVRLPCRRARFCCIDDVARLPLLATLSGEASASQCCDATTVAASVLPPLSKDAWEVAFEPGPHSSGLGMNRPTRAPSSPRFERSACAAGVGVKSASVLGTLLRMRFPGAVSERGLMRPSCSCAEDTYGRARAHNVHGHSQARREAYEGQRTKRCMRGQEA